MKLIDLTVNEIGRFRLILMGHQNENQILSNENVPVGTPTIIVGIFFLGGIQLLFLGLIGEYILSIHGQVRKVPPMFVVERINF